MHNIYIYIYVHAYIYVSLHKPSSRDLKAKQANNAVGQRASASVPRKHNTQHCGVHEASKTAHMLYMCCLSPGAHPFSPVVMTLISELEVRGSDLSV